MNTKETTQSKTEKDTKIDKFIYWLCEKIL